MAYCLMNNTDVNYSLDLFFFPLANLSIHEGQDIFMNTEKLF